MAGVSLSVDLLGYAPIRELFTRLIARSQDQTPAMRAIGELVVDSVHQNFDQSVTPEGAAWKPSRRVRLHGGQTLILTQTLRKSIHPEPGPDSVVVGSPMEYAAVHQDGKVIQRKARTATLFFRRTKSGQQRFARESKAKYGMKARVGAHSITIPARKFLGLRATDWPKIADLLANHLTGGAA